MADIERPRPIWLNGVLYVPVLDDQILDAVRQIIDTDQLQPPVSSPVRLDELTRHVMLQDRRVRLTRIEFALLSRLVYADGQVVALEQLLRDVWGWVPAQGSAELVRTHIRSIRLKLAAAGVADTVLRNMRGQGYYFRYSVPQDEKDAESA